MTIRFQKKKINSKNDQQLG